MLYFPHMKAHPLELRERIVAFVKKGGTKTQAAILFNVGRRSVYRYLDAEKNSGLAPKPWGGSPKKFDSDRLMRDVRQRPDATLAQRAKILGVNPASVWKRLRQLGVTLKKTSALRRKG
jgi:putative transposase